MNRPCIRGLDLQRRFRKLENVSVEHIATGQLNAVLTSRLWPRHLDGKLSGRDTTEWKFKRLRKQTTLPAYASRLIRIEQLSGEKSVVDQMDDGLRN